MIRYAALLRAVNVGGRTVRMEELRAIFHGMGFADVRTLLASGNVLFAAADEPAGLQARLEQALQSSLGYEVKTFIRSVAEMAAVVERGPYTPGEIAGAAAFNVAFLERALRESELSAVMALRSPVDDFRIRGRELYWLCQVKQSESEFSNARLERAAGIRSTIRGWNTVRKLAAALA